ncbi:hypothetical protein [Bradyrhizobium sp. 35]|uniref:hypothetical protein n=1 Tax=Bradyrhizobium sp. 35 TaxID=2782670 RepID=UPI001FF7C189|nr:hypothetical protein [Bradyrhizobium sp. 35]
MKSRRIDPGCSKAMITHGLGKKEGEELVYMGKIGTGWDRTTSGKIRKALDTVVRRRAKLTK